MLRNWRVVFLFALVAIFSIWIWWWASSNFPLSHPICGGGQTANDCPSYNIILYSAWRLAKAADHWSVLITALATIAIGYFTYTLYTTSIEQAKLTRESIDVATNEFVSSHRPRIRLKHLWLTEDIWGKEQITVSLGIVNNGTGEATLNTMGIRFVIVRAGRPIPFDPDIPDIPGVNVAGVRMPVGVWWTYPNIRNGTQLTDAEVADIQNGVCELYCLGFVSYYDDARNMRITGFCRILTLPPFPVPHTIQNCRFRKFDDPDYEYED